MDLDILRDALGWCAILNWILLAWWFLFFRLGHDWIYRMHSRWFKIPEEKFDTIHYAGMALYKTAIIMFNLIPYLALRIVG